MRSVLDSILALVGLTACCASEPAMTLRMPVRFGADPVIAPTGYGIVAAPQMQAAPMLVYPQAPAVQYQAPNPCAPALNPCAPQYAPGTYALPVQPPQYQYAPVAPPAAPPPSPAPQQGNPCPAPPVAMRYKRCLPDLSSQLLVAADR